MPSPSSSSTHPRAARRRSGDGRLFRGRAARGRCGRGARGAALPARHRRDAEPDGGRRRSQVTDCYKRTLGARGGASSSWARPRRSSRAGTAIPSITSSTASATSRSPSSATTSPPRTAPAARTPPRSPRCSRAACPSPTPRAARPRRERRGSQRPRRHRRRRRPRRHPPPERTTVTITPGARSSGFARRSRSSTRSRTTS